MTDVEPRLRGAGASGLALCDGQVVGGHRLDETEALGIGLPVEGRWPDRFEVGAVLHRVSALSDCPTWESLAKLPSVAGNVRERSQLLRLDQAILDLLPHLQHVCQRPRLYLRVEEERLPTSRARRVPARAIADLVAHPGDWEHRTLRSIQPSRVLARTLEDEWSIYENRVAARLVDHLLAYLSQRLSELQRIANLLRAGRDHSDEATTSFWKARRLMELWGSLFEQKAEAALAEVVRKLERTLHKVQALLDSPLYRNVSQRLLVGLSLKKTNVLVNDPHYRKVARLWRLWVKHGHRVQETKAQRLARRNREGRAWDRFALLLVVRALDQLGWRAVSERHGWTLSRNGYQALVLQQDERGVVHLKAVSVALRILPLCAEFSDASEVLDGILGEMDSADGSLLILHAGEPALLRDRDRATGWSFAGQAIMLGCSPWQLDSEERVRRCLGNWLNQYARLPYPVAMEGRALPLVPQEWDWCEQRPGGLAKLRNPTGDERDKAAKWFSRHKKRLRNRPKKLGSGAVELRVLAEVESLLVDHSSHLAALVECPVCAQAGSIEVGGGTAGRPATWLVSCDGDQGCGAEWDLRQCTGCGAHYHALQAEVGLDLGERGKASNPDEWPDRFLGSDVWAQPCAGNPEQFRCPHCGTCGAGSCGRCAG